MAHRWTLLLWGACILVCSETEPTSLQEGRFAAFMFPPPKFCFSSNKSVYLATSISDGL